MCNLESEPDWIQVTTGRARAFVAHGDEGGAGTSSRSSTEAGWWVRPAWRAPSVVAVGNGDGELAVGVAGSTEENSLRDG